MSFKYLVTGGAGFIGSNLAEVLLARGDEVVVLDNFINGKRENLASFSGNLRFKLIEGDIRDFEICRQAVSGCDIVFHEAALGSVPRSMQNPQQSLEFNVQGFCNMIEASRLAGVKRFVYASSSSVYGDDPHQPKQENLTGNARSPYALSKQLNEKTAELYGRIFGMSTIGLRYFNVFGRRQDPFGPYSAVIPRFVMSLMQHRSPIINGDGSFSRDFTYVDNVIHANLLAAAASEDGFVCNVAAGERTTLNELFAYLREELSLLDPEIGRIKAEYGPERAGDIPHSFASIEQAKRKLGYVPKYNIRAGLKEAVRWYYENLK